MGDGGEISIPQPGSHLLQERLGDLAPVRQARTAHGDVVVVARRVLLQSPIWFHARLANKHAFTAWVWDEGHGVRRGISTVNSEPLDGRPAGGKQVLASGGLLRFIDLDLLLALAYHWQETGETMIDVDQETVLSWIGYPRLEVPPYFELRAAVMRIQATQLRLFEERPGSPVDMRILPPLLVEPASYKDGRRNRLRAHLGEGWLSEMRRENQVISLRSYLPLVRCIREADQMARHNRAPGLPDAARLVLLFLDAFRTPQQNTVVKLPWLHERYGDRKVSIPDLIREPAAQLVSGALARAEPSLGGWPGLPDPPTAQRFRYLDPLHPQGLLRRALDLLGTCQIITGYEVQGDRLEVRWQDPSRLPMPVIAQRTIRQAKIFRVDKLTGAVSAVDVDHLPHPDATTAPEPPPPATPQQPLLPAPEPPVEVAVAAKPPPVAAPPPEQTSVAPQPGSLGELLRILIRRHCPLKAVELNGLQTSGWTDARLAALITTALYHHEVAPLPGSAERVKLPTRFILSRLQQDTPETWTVHGMGLQGFDPAAIKTWCAMPGGLWERLRQRPGTRP
jgi:hypothetical protein